MNKFGLPERTVNKLIAYFQSRPNIEKVCIYGSRAKGTYRNGSDIDFAIWLTDENDNVACIAGELDELPTPYKYDIINYKTLTHKGMKNSIDNDGMLFFQQTTS